MMELGGALATELISPLIAVRAHFHSVIASSTRIVPPVTISALNPARWINPARTPGCVGPFEVSAGFAEPRSAQADGPDLELLAHEMIQRHASPLLRTPVKTLAWTCIAFCSVN